MENGRVYLDKGSLYIYDSEIYIGMKYEDFEKKYSSRIKRISKFTDYAGLDCKSVTLFETPIYDMECRIIKVIFTNDLVEEINIVMDTKNIEVVSEKRSVFTC